MRRLPTMAFLMALAALVPTPGADAQQSQVVDGVAAVVDGEVITQGQLQRTVRSLAAEQTADAEGLEAIDPTAGCTAPTGAAPSFEERVLECMIDDLVQFQYVRRFPQFDVPTAQIDEALQRYIDAFDSPEAFTAALAEQQKTIAEVRYDLERESLIANYIRIRYRDVVEVSNAEIERYYEDILRPEMNRLQALMPELEDVDDELIAPMLFEAEVNRRVDEWVADLRRRADILVYIW